MSNQNQGYNPNESANKPGIDKNLDQGKKMQQDKDRNPSQGRGTEREDDHSTSRSSQQPKVANNR